MDNVLEICNWLLKHPRILQFANQMFAASSLSLAQVNSFDESSSSDILISANSIDNKVIYIIIFLENSFNFS